MAHPANPRRAADALAGLLALPVLDLAALRATVDAGPRACADADPDLFFPPDTDDQNDSADGGPSTVRRGPSADARAARRICAACPVRPACLASAMTEIEEVVDGVAERTTYAPAGFWGGLDETERAALAPQWKALRRLAEAGPPPAVSIGTVVRDARWDECRVCLAQLDMRHPGRKYCSMACSDRAQTQMTAARRAARADKSVAA